MNSKTATVIKPGHLFVTPSGELREVTRDGITSIRANPSDYLPCVIASAPRGTVTGVVADGSLVGLALNVI
jgi:hypothetical protein